MVRCKDTAGCERLVSKVQQEVGGLFKDTAGTGRFVLKGQQEVEGLL
jgi:hypothetical protein